MQALQFEGSMNDAAQIQVPADIARKVPEGSHLKVILVLDDDEDETWKLASLEAFSAAYAPEDSIYEKLLDEPSDR